MFPYRKLLMTVLCILLNFYQVTNGDRGHTMKKSIGTYNEKTVHSVLKAFFEPDKSFHEVRYKGLIADIKKDNNITEIQSAQFGKLRDKISAFTAEDELTVVYPIPRQKKIVRIDTQNGEMSKPRVSPKKGTVYDIFPEMYGIKDLLCNSRLHFRAVLLDITEYRYVSVVKGSRKKVRRADRIPFSIAGITELRNPCDVEALIPEMLNREFTSEDFAKAAGISGRTARTVILVMRTLGILKICGKSGRFNLYVRTDSSYLQKS